MLIRFEWYSVSNFTYSKTVDEETRKVEWIETDGGIKRKCRFVETGSKDSDGIAATIAAAVDRGSFSPTARRRRVGVREARKVKAMARNDLNYISF